MDFSQFNFEQSIWLWGFLIIPFVWLVYAKFYKANQSTRQLEQVIDKNLLPHLLITQREVQRSLWKPLLLWAALWSCLILALAGPRWDFKEIDVFTSDQSLVILLDLSQSMNAKDVSPSRLARAQQEIEDLLNLAQGIKIALIAYAADPHMINPLTDDIDAIKHLLPSLDTDLVFVQGSRLMPALTMAEQILAAEPGQNKSILVVSDGGFEDASALTKVSELAEQGIIIHTLGIGKMEGAPIIDREGNFIKQNGAMILTKLDAEQLKETSRAGHGQYLEAHYSDQDSQIILDQIKSRVKSEAQKQQKTRHWEERFYLFLLPLMLVLLFWFRRGFVFPALLLTLVLPIEDVSALEIGDYFKNNQQRGQAAFKQENFNSAAKNFQDPYRKGVAEYKAGNFAEAEALFSQSTRPEVRQEAAYNLGNSLVKQNKLKEAISAYESLLAENPEHEKAQHNLDLVKKLLDQQQQNNEQQSQDENQQDKQGSDSDSESESESDQSEQSKNSSDNKQSDSEQTNQSQDSESEGNDKQNQQQDSEQQDNENNAVEQNQASKEEGATDHEEHKAAQQPEESSPPNAQDDTNQSVAKSQQDIEADQWLNRITNDPKSFLKNQFYIESKRQGTREGGDPW